MNGSHGGNLSAMAKLAGRSEKEILDFSANINPLGFPEWMRSLLNSEIDCLLYYPDPEYSSLREALKNRFEIPWNELFFGNGSSELLYSLSTLLYDYHTLLPVPSFSEYEKVLRIYNMSYQYLYLKENINFEIDYYELESLLKKHAGRKIAVLLGHPNNPTGSLLQPDLILGLARKYENSLFIIDEAFIDFSEGFSFRTQRLKNMILLWSMTKVLAIPGLRAGIGIADPEICSKISARIPPWSLNSLSALIMKKAAEDSSFFEQTCFKVQVWKEQLCKKLNELDAFQIFPSAANFLLLKIKTEEMTSENLYRRLLIEHQIGIRDCKSYVGLNHCFIRIAVRTPLENERLLNALRAIFIHPHLKPIHSRGP